MINLSEENIRENCPHCDTNSFAYKYKLKTTANFTIICDVHPLTEGHILIIPKNHLSCIGVYPQNLYSELENIYQQVKIFIKSNYNSIATFEHGIIGQTVFHSHIQMFPYSGSIESIIPEGKEYFKPISMLSELVSIYKNDGKYLFCSIESKSWIVNSSLGNPGFFRDRFGKALGKENRAKWKNMHEDEDLMKQAEIDIANLINKWKSFAFK